MRKFATIVLALSFLALPAAADSRRDRNNDRQRHTAQQADRFAAPAQELVRAAHRVHERAEQYTRHGHRGHRREAAALWALHRLDRTARRFQHRIERGYRPTSWEIQQLKRSYSRAQARFGDFCATKRIARDFERVAHALNHLERVYATRSHRHDRYAAYRPSRHSGFYAGFGWR